MDHTEAVETLAPERYLLNEMTVEDREAFEEHYFGCAECAADLRAESSIIAGVRARKAASQPSRWAFWSSTAAAAVMAVVLAYQNGVVIPQLAAKHEQSQQPVVMHQVVPLTLGEWRGEKPAGTEGEGNKVHQGSQPFALKFDIPPVDGATGYDLEIVDARGKAMPLRRVSADEASESREISFGGGMQPGRYTLKVTPRPAGKPSAVSFDVQ